MAFRILGRTFLAILCGLGLMMFGGTVSAQELPKKRLRKIVGAPSKDWACPKQGIELRFHTGGGGRRHVTDHEVGPCFRVIKKEGKGDYKLWIDAVDAVVSGYVYEHDLAPVVQARSLLRSAADEAMRPGPDAPGIQVDVGTPIILVKEASTMARVELPPADIVGRGWISKKRLGITARQQKKRKHAGKRIWIPGQVEMLDEPGGKKIARIARVEDFVAAVRLGALGDHVLVSYRGKHAVATGWIDASDTRQRHQPTSDTEIGLAKIEDTFFWAEAGERIYDRPAGQGVGVFRRDTELFGRALKNGWIHLPVATELGTFNLWSPLYNKHSVQL